MENTPENKIVDKGLTTLSPANLKTPKQAAPIKWYKHLSVKIMFFIILLVCAIAYFARNIMLGTPVDVVYASTGALTQTAVASGRILTPQRISIASESISRVIDIPVDEGQTVKRGQILIQLNDAIERANVASSNASLLQAHAKLRQLNEVQLPSANQSLNQANTNLAQLRAQLARTHKLQQKGFISQAQVDTAKRDFEVAASELNTARLQVKTNQASGSDVALANASIAEAAANLKLANIKLQESTILAPADGTLISRNVEIGDTAQMGQELMVLAASGETQIAVLLDEKNIAKIAINQPALASADAFASQKFNAIVSYINPGIDASRGSVEIKLRVTNPPTYLRQDMTVSVDIITASKTNALTIPTATLRDASSSAPWVMVIRNKRAVHQPLILGLRGDNQVEVLSGLANNEPILFANAGTITPKERVRLNNPALK